MGGLSSAPPMRDALQGRPFPNSSPKPSPTQGHQALECHQHPWPSATAHHSCGQAVFLGSGVNQNDNSGRKQHCMKSFPVPSPTDMFISINYSENPTPARVMEHGIIQLKDKNVMSWPVTPHSGTCTGTTTSLKEQGA